MAQANAGRHDHRYGPSPRGYSCLGMVSEEISEHSEIDLLAFVRCDSLFTRRTEGGLKRVVEKLNIICHKISDE